MIGSGIISRRPPTSAVPITAVAITRVALLAAVMCGLVQPLWAQESATEKSATEESATEESATEESATQDSATQDSATRNSAQRGARTYRLYCQSCHGPEGRGDGPLAVDLKHSPPDLTLLAQRADGWFPAFEVRRKIEGRDPVATHGPSEMPVWGLTFELRGDADASQVEQRLDDLVEWIRGLQR